MTYDEHKGGKATPPITHQSKVPYRIPVLKQPRRSSDKDLGA